MVYWDDPVNEEIPMALRLILRVPWDRRLSKDVKENLLLIFEVAVSVWKSVQ